jgi:hypothetical protein
VIQWEPAWDPRRVRWRGTDDGAAARQVWLGAPPSQRRTRAGGPWPACPVGFLTSLAHAGASFTDAHGGQHPSHRTTWQCSPDPPTASPVTPVPSHQGISPPGTPTARRWRVSPVTPKTYPVSASPAAPRQTDATHATTSARSTSPTFRKTSPPCPPSLSWSPTCARHARLLRDDRRRLGTRPPRQLPPLGPHPQQPARRDLRRGQRHRYQPPRYLPLPDWHRKGHNGEEVHEPAA